MSTLSTLASPKRVISLPVYRYAYAPEWAACTMQQLRIFLPGWRLAWCSVPSSLNVSDRDNLRFRGRA